MACLSGKELSKHLSTLEIEDDTIQDMKILHRQVPILFFITTNGLVVLLDFESADESLSYYKELILRPTHHSYYLCNRCFEYIDKLLANGLRSSAREEDVIRKMETQTKEEIKDMTKLDSGIEILELVLTFLVPKFGNNKLKHDRHQITSKLRNQNNGSFKIVCAQEEGIRYAL